MKRAVEHGMFYISMNGEVFLAEKEQFFDEERAVTYYQAILKSIKEDMLQAKNTMEYDNSAKELITTYILPYRIH